MKLICAPMATLSHPAFRMLIERFGGCDEYYTEMINAPTLLCGGQFEKYYLEPAPAPEKIIWQLTGKNASSIIKASTLICNLPGIGIDLNMGCCAPDIVKSGAGISWMVSKPTEETRELVKGVKEELSRYESTSGIHKRLSAKIRLGDEKWSEESLFSFCDMLCGNGVERITIHPRTQKEKYRDKPRHEYGQILAERYKSSGVKIVINGDIDSAQKAQKISEICSSCEGMMIGRAAVQKPWIFSLIKQHFEGSQSITKPTDLLELALDFVDNVAKYQPPEFWKTRLQRFFTYYCDNLSFAHFAKTNLLNYKSIEDTKEKLHEYFEKVPGDQIKCLK